MLGLNLGILQLLVKPFVVVNGFIDFLLKFIIVISEFISVLYYCGNLCSETLNMVIEVVDFFHILLKLLVLVEDLVLFGGDFVI